MKLSHLFSLLKSFWKRENPQREIDFVMDNMQIKCKLTYYRKAKVLEYKYYVPHGSCLEYQIPNSNKCFAKRMLKDFDKQIAEEIYIDDENLNI
jgi:hypothetical protein